MTGSPNDDEPFPSSGLEAIAELNERWLYWAKELSPVIQAFAYGDDDLTQEGIIALRDELAKDINSPRGHLAHRAQTAISNAFSRGSSVDSRKSQAHNDRSRDGGIQLVYLDAEPEYAVSSPTKYAPDVLAIDRVAYETFWASLSADELSLLKLMRQMSDLGQRDANYRQVFVRSQGLTRWEYEKLNAGLSHKFFVQFGNEQELAQFDAKHRDQRFYESDNSKKSAGARKQW